jgi:TolB-like protein
MSLFNELKRRNVIRVGIAYLVATWLLIQLSDILIPMLSLPEWVSKFIFLMLVILFIPTLIAAWALELTPDGIKLEKDIDRSQSITPNTGKTLNSLIVGALALAVAVLLFDKFYLTDEQLIIEDVVAEADKSIAVLPFADLSKDQDQEWFADGLAEEILNALVRTPDLLVASRTSSFTYKNSEKDLRAIAMELGVAHILEGSVRRAGERLRITAQLIRASDGFHLWSQNYDRSTEDVIEIQEDLAVQIAKALETTMDPEALADMLTIGTRSVEAYQFYVRALGAMASAAVDGDYAKTVGAYELLEKARTIDPQFSAAHRRAALFWLNQLTPVLTMSGVTDASWQDMKENYLERVDLAIETAPNPIERQAVEAQKALFEMKLRKAVRLYRAYVEERPNDFVAMGSLISAAIYASDSETIDWVMTSVKPKVTSHPLAAQNFVSNAYRTRDPVEAATVAREVYARWPNDSSLIYQVHRTLLWTGHYAEARDVANYYLAQFGDDEMVLARQACAEGRVDDVIAILHELNAEGPSNIAWLILILLDDKEGAEEALHPFNVEGMPKLIGGWLTYSKFDPTPFPELMAILERENVDRPPPVQMPYTCPPGY